MEKVILYIHGKGGNYLEGEQYKKNCPDYDIVGVDYTEELPWLVREKIQAVYDMLKKEYAYIVVIANSIGAYFAMHTLQGQDVKQALFISPVVDMEWLILDMMQWANITEQELAEKKEIVTDFGETLSWEYLSFVRAHPIQWDTPTEILYGEKDVLISRRAIDTFVSNHSARLSVMENGEHWFHTYEQLAFLDAWMQRVIW